MKTVFIGDSHAHAIIRALANSPAKSDFAAFDVRRVEDGRANQKDIPMELSRLYPASSVFCCVGGTEHNLLGLIESAAPFDFLLVPDDTLLPGRTPVTKGLVMSALTSRMRSALDRMAAIQAQYSCPFTCVAPPPPFGTIRENARLPRAFLPHLDRGIAPASVRLKIYTLQIELLAAHCEKVGIDFMLPPDAARDADGYLRDEFWDNDPTHGNALYGEAVISQMKDLQIA